jgi:hypothetical protein
MVCLFCNWCRCSTREGKEVKEAGRVNTHRKGVYLDIVSSRWRIRYVRKQNKRKRYNRSVMRMEMVLMLNWKKSSLIAYTLVIHKINYRQFYKISLWVVLQVLTR